MRKIPARCDALHEQNVKDRNKITVMNQATYIYHASSILQRSLCYDKTMHNTNKNQRTLREKSSLRTCVTT